jgi:hypothetical protein
MSFIRGIAVFVRVAVVVSGLVVSFLYRYIRTIGVVDDAFCLYTYVETQCLNVETDAYRMNEKWNQT